MKLLSKITNYLIGLAQKTGGEVLGEKTVDPLLAEAARAIAAEGIVLLKNDNGVLPLKAGSTAAVFGRVQYNYFYVGYGSGGDVKAAYKINLIEGLKNNGAALDGSLAELYKKWCDENPPDEGFWGHWPRYYDEMPLADSVAEASAKRADTAIVVVGRAAGEDREQALDKGGYYLTDAERNMLDTVTRHFSRVVLLINSGNIIDLSFLNEYGGKINSVLYVWQGGMESGSSAADIITGRVCPSGKLTDTIAVNYNDYPSANDFGGKTHNNYTEDIYVGYRYFETFARDAVLFPFGYGKSYTQFSISAKMRTAESGAAFDVEVQNIGEAHSGKEVVQVYMQAPMGVLGKPSRVLVAFAKTKLLAPNQSQTLTLEVPEYALMSYDADGVTGNKNCYIAEAGRYLFFVGNSARDNKLVAELVLDTPKIMQMQAVMPPQQAFSVLAAVKDGSGGATKKYISIEGGRADTASRISLDMPKEIPISGDKGIKLAGVANKSAGLDDFVGQLSLEELQTLCRGDIKMNSPWGTAGNAGALGGTTASLQQKGIPPIITTDGPSGIRLQHYASLLPCGTHIACSFNEDLAEQLYALVAREMRQKGSDMLLAPGMNIHRDPLCGRNFEYFSEDPLVSGKIGCAIVKGLQKNGVSACPKHFACNNQETNRNRNDSRVSQRALREIYLKGFEICIKESAPLTLMTAYNKINGIWCHYNYDLCTTVLRKEWGYKGCVITDWWMQPAKNPDFEGGYNCGYRIRAQVDALMPGGNRMGKYDGSAIKSYKNGGLTVAEMQRSAKNVLRLIIALGKY